MEAEARYTFVGASVLVLIAALVAGVLWLKNIGGRDNFQRFAIHFEKQALDGLEIGGDVSLRGIKVGRVEDYALFGDTSNQVRVAVRVDRRAPVRTDTVAVITRNFVTGIAAITLVNRDPPGEPLVRVPEGESLPVIAEGRSDLDEITGRVNKVGEMASEALANIKQLLDADNREAVRLTLQNLRDLSAGLNTRLGTLDSTLARVGSAATELGKGAAELGRSGGRIASVAESSGERLATTLTETERALADARAALQQVAQATGAIQQQALATARKLEDSAANVDDQLGTAVSEIRSSIETATRVLDRLREPRAALLGPNKGQLGPGEKLP
jgi:phospholipid/cholesterol/gamma-HCH transport system substrate-binding protein